MSHASVLTTPLTTTFAAGFVANSRQEYLSQNPAAPFRHKIVSLPSERALEIITSVPHFATAKKQLSIVYVYAIIHHGIGYSFTFVCSPRSWGNSRSLRPVGPRNPFCDELTDQR